MGLFFSQNIQGQCSLCASKNELTGEHKIKKSLIKSELIGPQYLFFTDAMDSNPKIAQGPKAKVFHFKAKICKDCNSSRTQKADKAFDTFHRALMTRKSDGDCITTTHLGNRVVAAHNENESDAFRYFAKLICCFLAEVGGPRPKKLASFAMGTSNRNPVFLSISMASIELAEGNLKPDASFLGHGGLACYFDEEKDNITAIKSSLTAGDVRYTFGIKLGRLEQLEMRMNYSEFLDNSRLVATPN